MNVAKIEVSPKGVVLSATAVFTIGFITTHYAKTNADVETNCTVAPITDSDDLVQVAADCLASHIKLAWLYDVINAAANLDAYISDLELLYDVSNIKAASSDRGAIIQFEF